MKCPKCGYENARIRLFCSNCGIVLPDVDETDLNITAQEKKEPVKATEIPSETPETIAQSVAEDKVLPFEEDLPPFEATDGYDHPDENELFADFDDDLVLPSKPKAAEKKEEKRIDEIDIDELEDTGTIKKSEPVIKSNRANTLIPEREAIPADKLFQVRGQNDDYVPEIERDDDFDDDEKDDFLIRHTRGIVTFLLLMITVMIVVIWSLSDGAQRLFAQKGIALKAEPYAKLGYEAYDAGDFENAADYFRNANKHSQSEEYLICLHNCCLETEDPEGAADALRECIGINPYKVDYYLALEGILGGRDKLSEEDRQLFRDGYVFTGDPRLNIEN